MDIAELGFRVDTTDLVRGERALDKMDSTNARLIGSSGGVTGAMKGIAAAAIAAAGAAGVGGFVSTAANFDASMNNVQAKLLISTDAMGGLRDMAAKLGSETSFSASQAADGMGYLAQAGLNANEIMQAMPDALNLASAAQLSLAQSADIATNVMGAFKLNVGDIPAITDVLAATSAKANTSVSELASAIKQAGPIAAGFGVDMYAVSAAVGQLANNGFKGEQAGMILKNMFSSLVNPVGDGEKALISLGLQLDDFYLKAADGTTEFLGMRNMMEKLGEAGADTTDILRIFGAEAGPGMIALIGGGADVLDELETGISGIGFASEAARIQMQGLPGIIKTLGSTWEGFQLALMGAGGTGIANKALTALTEVIRGATKLVYDAGEAYTGFTTKLSGTGSMAAAQARQYGGVYDILRDIGQAFTDIAEFIKPITPYLKQFGIAFAAVGATAGGIALVATALGAIAAVVLSPVVLAIGAVAAGAVLLRNSWDGISEWWAELWAPAKDFSTWWETVTFEQKLLDVQSIAVEEAQKAAEKILTWWNSSEFKQHALSLKAELFDSAKSKAEAFVGWWEELQLGDKEISVQSIALSAASEAIKALQFTWNNLTLIGRILPIDDELLASAKSLAEDFVGWWNTTTFKEKVAQISTGQLDLAARALESLRDLWNNSSLPVLVADVDVGPLSGAKASIADFVRDTNSAIGGMALAAKSSSLVTVMSSMWSEIAAGASTAWGSIVSGAKKAFPDVFSGLAVAAADVRMLLGELTETARVWTSDFMILWTRLWPDLRSIIGSGWNIVVSVFDNAWVLIKESVHVGWDLVVGVLKGGLQMLRGDFVEGWNTITETVVELGVNMYNAASNIGSKMFSSGREIIVSMRDGLLSAGSIVIKALASIGETLAEKAKDIVLGVGRNWLSGLASLNPFAKDTGRGMAEDVGTTFVRTLDREMDAVGPVLASVGREAEAGARDIGENIGKGAEDGMFSWIGNLFSAGKESGEAAIDGLADGAGTQSPSWKGFDIGMWTGEGMANGLMGSGALITGAAKDVSEGAISTFGLMAEKVKQATSGLSSSLDDSTLSIIAMAREAEGANKKLTRAQEVIVDLSDEHAILTEELLNGADAAELLKHKVEGYSYAEAVAAVNLKSTNEALRERIREAEAAESAVSDLLTAQELQTIELTQGADAARAAELGTKGYSQAQIDLTVATEASMKLQKEFYNGIKSALVNADSVKDAFRNLGDFMKNWLKDKIATFATQKIMVMLGMGDGGFESGLGGILANAGGMLKSFGGKIAGFFGQAGTAATGAGSNIASMGSSVGQAGTAASAASGGFVSMLGPIAAMSAAANQIGTLFGDLVGAADSAKAGIGAMIGGIQGTIVGAALGGSWKKIEEGFEIAFTGGALTGRGIEYFEKERSLWRGTASSITFTELDARVKSVVGAYFTSLTDGVTSAANKLGVAGASKIMDSFSVAVKQFRGENAEDELQEWLEESTRKAYRLAYDKLGPELQAIVSRSVDLVNSPAQDIEETFKRLGTIASELVPMLQAAGINLGDTFDAAIATTSNLVDAMGGLENANKQLTLYYNEIVPAAERANLSLQAHKQSLENWNTEIGRGDNALAVTLGTYYRHNDAIAATGVTLQELGASYDVSTNGYRLNRQALIDHMATLDASTEAGGRGVTAIMELLGASESLGVAAITSRDQMHAYIQTIDTSTAAGQAQFASAMQQLDALIALDNAQKQNAANLESVAEVADRLNLRLDPTSPLMQAATDSLLELMGGLEKFKSATSSYYESFYTDAEKTAIKQAEAAAAVLNFNAQLDATTLAAAGITDGLIDSKPEFRAYVESLNLQTQAGREAFAAAMELQSALLIVAESEGSMQDAIDALPENLRNAFNSMNNSATATADAVAETLARLQRESAESLARTGDTAADLFASMLSSTGTTADQIADSLANAYNGIINNTTITGNELTDALGGAFAQVMSQAGVVRSQLPAELQAGYDALLNSSVSAAEALRAHADGMADGVTGSALDMRDGTVRSAAQMQRDSANETATMAQMVWLAFQNMVGSGRMMERSIMSSANNMRGAMGLLGDAANDAARRISNAAHALKNTGFGGVNGSHAAGKDRIPFDGYIAETHKDEAILPAPEADQYRKYGLAGPANVSVSPNISVRSESRSESPAMKAMAKELADMRKEQAKLLTAIAKSNGHIAAKSSEQSATLNKIDRSNGQLQRKIGKVVA